VTPRLGAGRAGCADQAQQAALAAPPGGPARPKMAEATPHAAHRSTLRWPACGGAGGRNRNRSGPVRFNQPPFRSAACVEHRAAGRARVVDLRSHRSPGRRDEQHLGRIDPVQPGRATRTPGKSRSGSADPQPFNFAMPVSHSERWRPRANTRKGFRGRTIAKQQQTPPGGPRGAPQRSSPPRAVTLAPGAREMSELMPPKAQFWGAQQLGGFATAGLGLLQHVSNAAPLWHSRSPLDRRPNRAQFGAIGSKPCRQGRFPVAGSALSPHTIGALNIRWLLHRMAGRGFFRPSAQIRTPLKVFLSDETKADLVISSAARTRTHPKTDVSKS